MATPCEELGYKVGDEFEVIVADEFSKGSIIKLIDDDGSDCPHFELVSGRSESTDGQHYYLLDDIKPLAKNGQLTPQTTTEPDIIARLTQATKALNDLPALISELNALLPEGYEVVRTTEVTTQVTPQATTEDMSDWRNWREGGFITPQIDFRQGWWTTGKMYEIVSSEHGLAIVDDDGDLWDFKNNHTPRNFIYHDSRPSKEVKS